MTNRVIVALPAYNEEKYVAGIVGKATGYADVVVVLDDGSTDGTAWRAVNAGAKLLQHKKNKGYGVAIQGILSAARATDFEILVIIDSDGQHSPDDIPVLVKAIRDGADIAIGCRAGKDVPLYRRIGGTTLSAFTWMLSGLWVQDSQCGFRAYSRRAVEWILPRETGMAVSSEIVILAARSGLKIVEVPIHIKYSGNSSTHNPWRQGFYTLRRIIVMMMRMRSWR